MLRDNVSLTDKVIPSRNIESMTSLGDNVRKIMWCKVRDDLRLAIVATLLRNSTRQLTRTKFNIIIVLK